MSSSSSSSSGGRRSLSGFQKDALRVLAGSGAATAITFLSLPVLARLYAVSDFGSVQVMLSIVGVLGPIAALRYDVAIVLARSAAERRGAVWLALTVALGFVVASGLGLAAFRRPLAELLAEPFLVDAIPLVVAGVLLTALGGGGGQLAGGAAALVLAALGGIGEQLLIAGAAFGRLARAGVAQALAGSALTIGAGLVRATPQGLFLGRMLPNLVLATAAFWSEPVRPDASTLREARRVARVHRKLPLFDTLSVLLNTAAVHLPVFFFAHFFSAREVGLYMMAGRLLDAPISLVTGALSRVYLREGTASFQRGAAELRELYLTLQKRLILAGLAGALLGWLLAPDAVVLFLGEEWAPVGAFVRILLIWKLFEFLNVPTSMSLVILGRQEVGLALRILSLAVRVAAVWTFSEDPQQMLLALSIAAGAYYAAFNLSIHHLLTREARRA